MATRVRVLVLTDDEEGKVKIGPSVSKWVACYPESFHNSGIESVWFATMGTCDVRPGGRYEY